MGRSPLDTPTCSNTQSSSGITARPGWPAGLSTVAFPPPGSGTAPREHGDTPVPAAGLPYRGQQRVRPGRALWSQVGHECSVNLSGSHSALLMLHFLVVRPHPHSDSDTGLAGKGEPGREALSVPAWERIWFFRLIESVLAHPAWLFGGGSN